MTTSRRRRTILGMRHADSGGVWSTSVVESGQAFEYWRDLICDTFVQLSASPVGDRVFEGRITHRECSSFDMSVVAADGQRVRRTPSLIARSGEAYVLASIQTVGYGRVEQDGRTAELAPGSMAFYDSTRPYTLHFDARFEQIVVQVPRDVAVSAAGLRESTAATAHTLPTQGVGRVVADFFTSLVVALRDDPVGAEQLSCVAVDLFASALGLMVGRPSQEATTALHREQVVSFLRKALSDQRLDAETIAAHFHVSRRTLFRQFAGEPDGVTGLLRRMRVERAQRLLLGYPARSVREIAGACGFAGEAQFYRTFREITGSTPGGYRAAALHGTNSQHDGTPGEYRRPR